MKLRALLFVLASLTLACGDDAGMGSGTREGDGLDRDDDDDGVGTVTLRDGGIDPGVVVASCEGEDDGTSCGAMGGLLCLDDECVSSMCGDGFVDPAREACDDGDVDPGDGCEEDCSLSCADDDACSDGNPCDGIETCDGDLHVCTSGVLPDDGEACATAAVEDGECRDELCVPQGCGDEVVEGDEECDDGNPVSGDGCEPTCTFTCETDEDCFDGNVCTGVETCDLQTHTCEPGTALTCEAEDECSEGTCHPEAGCRTRLIDADGDGYAPDTLACGDDCDDTRADVNRRQAELCDDVDHDCDGEPQPKDTPTWYVDCDADGYAALNAAAMRQCDEPAAAQCGGRWTTREPAREDLSTFDCNDHSADTRPSQTAYFTEAASGGDFDFDCSGTEELRWQEDGVSPDAPCSLILTCGGVSGWTAKASACGDRGEYSECVGEIGGGGCDIRGCGCSRVTVTRTQECR